MTDDKGRITGSRLYVCEHRTAAGRFGIIKIHAATWAEAEEIARRVIVVDASPLEVTGYQDGDWDDTIPATVDLERARAFVSATMRAVEEALR